MLFRGFLAVGVASASSVLERVLLPNEYADQGGRCMDGTMAGYYYQAPPNTQHTWVIHMDGGGGCSTKKACEKWAKKGNGAGSSTNWPATRDPLINKALGILSDDPDVNPDFHGAHHVQVPYCTADGHAGTVTKPTSAQWGWYFSGHLNFELIVQHIVDTIPAAKEAKRVLLTGKSAGGIGTIHNCDFLADKLASLGISAEVSCAPKAGWFVPGFTEDQEDSELPPSSWDNWSVGKTGGPESGGFQIWQSYAHPDCLKAHSSSDAHLCGSASVVYPFIRTRMYVMQNNYDPAQINGQFGLPKKSMQSAQAKEYIAYFGRAMRNSTNQILMKPGDGIFLASCFAHGDGLGVGPVGTTKVKGLTSAQGLGDWFSGQPTLPTILVDDCNMESPGLPCNPTCKGVTTGVVV